MGPLRESGKEQKAQLEKEAARSRIPRLVLRPQQKASPASESPFSEEESREFNPPSSSVGSGRTLSSNSFCSDDTGCPSSQSVSPVKTPSDAGNSPISFCTGSDGDFSRKKFSPGTISEGNLQLARYKKETKTSLVKPGSEADFSSSSSSASISAPKVHMSAAGSKRSFSRNSEEQFPRENEGSSVVVQEGKPNRASKECTSRNCPQHAPALGQYSRGPYARNNGSLSNKSGASPPASREKDPLPTLCKKQLSPANIYQSYKASSASSSNSDSYRGSNCSPVMRRSGRLSSCDNHILKPQNAEQYLTPLQQKEVTVRHLKTKLKESENKLQERETEIAELKAQLVRMREDWIEEECTRVEAELALQEARSEIKQLKEVIETMQTSLAERDRKIEKYCIDINVQNKKLESLLQTMEMAQDEQCLDYRCDPEEKPSPLCATMPDSIVTGDQALEEVTDSGLLPSEEITNGTDLSEEGLITTASDFSDPAPFSSAAKTEMFEKSLDENLASLQKEEKSGSNIMVEKAVQTDVVLYSLDVEQHIQNIIGAQGDSSLSQPSSLKELNELSCQSFSDSGIVVDLTSSDPYSAILLSTEKSPCKNVEHREHENCFVKELDFTEPCDNETFGHVCTVSETGIERRYWSSSLLRDVLAVAAPVVPTIIWAFSTQRRATNPIYGIGTLLRGCCLVALCSLRHTPFNMKS